MQPLPPWLGTLSGQGVRCLREGKLMWDPGFDGEYRQVCGFYKICVVGKGNEIPLKSWKQKERAAIWQPFQGGRMKFIKKSAPGTCREELVISVDKRKYIPRL